MSLTHCQTIVLIVPRQILSLRPPFLAPVFTSLFAVRYIPHFQSQFFFLLSNLCVLTARLWLSYSLKMNEKERFSLSLSIHSARCDEPSPILLVRKEKIELCHSSHMLLIPTLVGVVEGALRFFFPILLWTNVTCTRARDFGRPLLSLSVLLKSFGTCFVQRKWWLRNWCSGLFHCTCDEIYMKLVRVINTYLFTITMERLKIKFFWPSKYWRGQLRRTDFSGFLK